MYRTQSIRLRATLFNDLGPLQSSENAEEAVTGIIGGIAPPYYLSVITKGAVAQDFICRNICSFLIAPNLYKDSSYDHGNALLMANAYLVLLKTWAGGGLGGTPGHVEPHRVTDSLGPGAKF